MKLEAWLLFVSIWTAAVVPIGPNALNCISTSMTQGFRSGLWSVLGVFIAGCIFVTLTITGLTATLAANGLLFEVIRWIGVVYLGWLGFKLLFQRGEVSLSAQPKHYPPHQLVYRSTAIVLSNPKALFMWFFVFSQFLDPSQPVAPQLAILAPTGLAIPVITYTIYCALGSGAARFFSGSRKRWLDRIIGLTYIGFASGLAVSDLRR